MPKSNLTETTIAAMAAPDPSGKQVLHWDADGKKSIKGFAVLCSGVTTTKTYIVQRDLPNGRTRRLTVGPVNTMTLDAARKLAADMLLKLSTGDDPKNKDANATLQAMLDKYIATRRDLSPASIRVYRQIEKYLQPWLELKLKTITSDMIEARHGSLAAEVGGFTANGVMRTFRIVWNFYGERVPLPPNPVKILKRQWFTEPRRERMIPPDKMPEFYRAVCALDNKICRDLLLLIAFTGFRKTEASSLRWEENIDLQNRTIIFAAERTKPKRELPISDFVYELLVARRALGNAKFVFPGPGKHGHVSDLQRPLDAIAKQTGIVFSAHDLRRGFSTVAESLDISMTALKALLDHAPARDVTSGYIIISPERLREPVQRIADKLKELCGIAPMGGNVTKLKAKRASK
jgi:integrase